LRGGAGLHADPTGRQRSKEGQHFAAPQPAADPDLPVGIDAVDLKPVLGEIKADGSNLHGGRLLSCVAFTDDHVWHIDAGSGGRPQHQDFRDFSLS
jgi:hypothetical protein